MTTIQRIALIVALITFILPGYSLAQGPRAEIYANAHDIRANVGWQFPAYESYPEIGFGLDYSDDYLISNANFALKDDVLVPGLTLGLGLRGFFGEVEIADKDFDLRAMGVLVLGEYELKGSLTNLPITVSASLSLAPESLCFSDTDRYLEFSSAIYFYIVQNAAIGIGYRDFDARFDEPSGEVKKSDDALFLGCKFSF